MYFEAAYPRLTISLTDASPPTLPQTSHGSLPVAELSLTARGSHPLDDISRFHECLSHFNSSKLAVPGRTADSMTT